jgi:hypothetical protein
MSESEIPIDAIVHDLTDKIQDDPVIPNGDFIFEPNWDILALDSEDHEIMGMKVVDSELEDADLKSELELRFGGLVSDWELISYGLTIFNFDDLPSDIASFVQIFESIRTTEPNLFKIAILVWPGLVDLFRQYDGWRIEQSSSINDFLSSDARAIEEQLADAFSREGEASYTVSLKDNVTQSVVNDIIKDSARENIKPETALPWELSIGASRFAIPPLNISVNSRFKVTNLSGGVIRQRNTPKFNTGHSETVVNVTLYFPNHESIWGFDGEGELDIDFDNDSEAKIDRFLSSLRGLVAAFKYSPFLPLKNEYLNSTFNMTGATLQGMTVQTLEGFPFVLAVNLTLLKFNHKAYLPMIRDFNEAIHWGKYRQYMGRSAELISKTVGRGFLNTEQKDHRNPAEASARGQSFDFEGSADFDHSNTYNKLEEFNDGKHFQMYFPRNSITKIFAPDTADFRTPEEDTYIDSNQQDLWDQFMTDLGFDIINPINSDLEYEGVIRYARRNTYEAKTEQEEMVNWLNEVQSSVADNATKERFELYVTQYIENWEARKFRTATDAERNEITNRLNLDWYALVFLGFRNTPYMQSLLKNSDIDINGNVFKEWQVPMEKMEVDWEKVIVNGVSVSLENNIARMQLQMQDEPVHQHIGGKDTTVNVSMTIIGEEELVSFRRVFDHISGLARLEHAHGVLGFLGIKNIITALCGVKYVLPLNFEVDTIPGYPHVYNVSLSFVDFDILQQRREQLDSSQQQQLIDAFGKRNPFLRIKQMWGVFNAYPDMPLSVKGEDGLTVGHVDPDYYFRSFQTIDDDLVHWKKPEPPEDSQINGFRNPSDAAAHSGSFGQEGLDPLNPAERSAHGGGYGEEEIPTTSIDDRNGHQSLAETGLTGQWRLRVDHTMGDFMEESSISPVIGVSGNTLDIMAVDTVTKEIRSAAYNATLEEDLAERTLTNPSSALLTSYADHQGAYYDTESLATLGIDSTSGYNPSNQFEKMMLDSQYRDISGRMIRAFPTYMLWLIDEGGNFAGVKLFDNFYGLQSVIDFSLVRSEDILGDTLVLRLSNMYSKLSTEQQDFLFYDPDEEAADGSNPTTNFMDNSGNQVINNLRHTQEQPPAYVQELEHIRLRPGVRLHLRAGYGANPNSLETLFNGTITEVQQGDILTVVAQSDAIELSPYVNTTSKGGHSGSIDGSFNTGFWLSEPRDLMVRLLSMGSSVAKEAIARGTRGTIFSESKFGIKHFGRILYEPMTPQEEEALQARVDTATVGLGPSVDASLGDEFSGNGQLQETIAGVNALAGGHTASTLTNIAGTVPVLPLGGFFQRNGVLNLMTSMWVNNFRDRDFEIFKRNIYPGNGTGVMQYAGLDTLDADIYWKDYTLPAPAGGAGAAPTYDGRQIGQYFANSINRSVSDGTSILETEFEEDELIELLGESRANHLQDMIDARANDDADTDVDSNSSLSLGSIFSLSASDIVTGVVKALAHPGQNPIYQALGLTGVVPDDDLKGFDEVSFRAQTYMRTVWDMFQICAAMLPNYIVSVRPFEDRSTVFYGKPHWLYTSGVVPLTTGVPTSNDLRFEQPNEQLSQTLELFSKIANRNSDSISQENFLLGLGQGDDPYSVHIQSNWGGGNIADLPRVNSDGGQLPGLKRKVSAGIEMHLPVHANTPTDNDSHKQLSSLPAEYKYPFYLDRHDGPRGGDKNFSLEDSTDADGNVVQSVLGEDSEIRGQLGAFGLLSSDEEQFYCNMRWPYSSDGGGTKIAGQSSSMFEHKRLLIFNEDNGRICICVPGEYGPNISTDLDMGFSPDVAWYLGGEGPTMQQRFNDNLWIGWVDDRTKLGPVVGSSIGVNEDGIIREDTDTSELTPEQIRDLPSIDASINYDNSEVINNISELFQNNKDRISLLNDTDIFRDVLGHPIEDLERYANSHYGNDLGTFMNLFGWAFDDVNPAFDTKGILDLAFENELDSGLENHFWTDSTGSALSESTWALMNEDADDNIDSIGGANISSDRATKIWNELRKNFINLDGAQGVFKEHEENRAGFVLWSNDNDSDALADYPVYQQLVAEFLQFMWIDPFRRAWVTVVADKNNNWYDLGNGFLNDNLDYGLRDGWASFIAPDELILIGSDIISDAGEKVDDAVGWITGGRIGGGDDETYSLNNIVPVWFHFSDPANIGFRHETTSGLSVNSAGDSSPNLNPMDEFMNTNRNPGSDSSDGIRDTVDGIKGWYDRNIGSVITAVGDLFSAVITSYRYQMSMMGMNLSSVAQMQLQANVLNNSLNDSIYYSSAHSDPLVRLADNPFTREYNEPVVEIREPFQRLHYLSSFQHIISNNISENLNGVNTVVTATSDGKYPVTVYFDKGSPPDRQVEGTTETGLFWDNARGSGFFSFLHPIINPLETIRGSIKSANGESDSTLSKRIALSHLREGLKDIYQGEILIVGDPDIRPHDLIYLSDVYNRIYGMCEVEQIVHHFTPDQGFVSSITPNAIVTVNDPSRWSLISYITGLFSMKDIRDNIRTKNDIVADNSSAIRLGEVTIDSLHNGILDQAYGSRQFTNGNTALLGDINRHSKMGLMTFPPPIENQVTHYDGSDLSNAISNSVSPKNIAGAILPNNPASLLGLGGLWNKAFEWVQENLQDQHGCYIQYLNKDGQPMDAGLSYNQGVAVGQWYTKDILPGVLNIPQRTTVDGHVRITSDDLLSALGWNEVDIQGAIRNVSWWVNQTNVNVLGLSGFGPDPITVGKPNVVMIKVTEVIDGDTIEFDYVHDDFDFTKPSEVAIKENLSTQDALRLRFSSVNAGEIRNYLNSDDFRLNEPSLGTAAANYVNLKLITEPLEQGIEPIFALRIDDSSSRDKFRRVLGTIFHTVPLGTPDEDRAEVLYKIATEWPLNPWDSYHDDGRPYTLNWDLVIKGLADVYLRGIDVGIKDWKDKYED